MNIVMALFSQLKHMPRNWISRAVHTAPRAIANTLPAKVYKFIEDSAERCGPKDIHICDGTEKEYNHIMEQLSIEGLAKKLPKYDNCWLVNTDPRDVARVESRTFICTKNKDDVVPHGDNPVQGVLPNWMSLNELDNVMNDRFRNCMNGRTMYVIPFSMGPVGSKYSKIGIQLTDSAYVAASMRTMTRMGDSVLDYVGSNDFVKCLHSVGEPIIPGKPSSKWPCNPEQTIIAHKPESGEIISFGSGYGGNSLLGKKCLALRLGSWMAREQGWLAEHMLILGITSPHSSKKRYIAAAFPSACGKTNLAMLTPKLPGYKVECVGDDIAWLHFDKQGQLRAINPENGFFGVAPGTNRGSNPVAMDTIFKDTVFTNVASTSDGGVWWEGMEPTSAQITDWKGQPWDSKSGKPAAHPNSRFTSPATNCPILDGAWEDPEGVPIDAILFGGRRPQGIPLVYEAFDWDHSVFIGTTMRSEATAAAEFKNKQVMNDPFAMRPFVGYNIGQYIDHWLNFAKKPDVKLPKVFHVNWFRKDEQNKFMWPGFGDNIRVLDWVLQRIENNDSEKGTVKTEIGYVPAKNSFNLDGLDNINWDELFRIDRPFWTEELSSLRKYLNDNIGSDLPLEIRQQLDLLESRVRG